MRKWFVLAALVVLAVAVSLPAAAGLTSVVEFAGDVNLRENWESFQNFYYPDPSVVTYISSASIMGGAANISSPYMAVYQPGIADFGAGFTATAHNLKGMGLDDYGETATIVGNKSWSSFGAYWAKYPGNTNSVVTVKAFYGSDSIFDTATFTYDRTDGGLVWHGWTSDKAITKVEYSGDFVAIDDLRANEYKQTSAVPEPATLLGFGLPMLMVGLGKLKSLRK